MNKKLKTILMTFVFVVLAFMIIGCTSPDNEGNNDNGGNTDTTFKITEIEVEEELVEIIVGEDYLLPIYYDGIGDFSDVNIEVDNEGIITLNGDSFTGVKPGIVNVTVSSKNDSNINATFTVYVNAENFKSSNIRILVPNDTLIVGKSLQMSIANMDRLNANSLDDFTFTVSDESIIKIDDDYKILALKNGEAKISVRQKDCPSNTGELTIYVGLQSNETTTSGEPENTPLITYFEDNNYMIDASIDEQIKIDGAKDYQRYHYRSSDENILLISDTGLFMGVTDGTVTVSIISKDSKSTITNNRITVTVTGTRERDFKERIIEVALAEEGYREWTNNNDTKFGEWNSCNYEAWCATFVSWCANNAGVPKSIVIRSISVTVYKTTYENMGLFYYKEDYHPVRGDLIIFKSNGASHVGIVTGSDSNYVYTIEGNTSNMVAQRTYPLDEATITGYCHPNY